MPNTISLTDYPIANDYQTRPQNPLRNPEDVEISPIYEYVLISYGRINMAVLNHIGIIYHLPLQQEI